MFENLRNVRTKIDKDFLSLPKSFSGPTQKMNLFQSVTSALDNTLASDPTAGKMQKNKNKKQLPTSK